MIKKVLAAALTAVMLMSVPVIADTGVDLSSMTLDELIELRDEISTEIRERTDEEGNFGAGGYLVGTDIKAGSYVYTPVKNANGYVGIFKDKESFEASFESDDVTGAILNEYVSAMSNSSVTLNLEDGQYLYVNCSPGILTENNASWLP